MNELMAYALEILAKRANDTETRTIEQRIAYQAAIDIIQYALDDNYECLAQFDY